MFNPVIMLNLVVVLAAGIALGFVFRNRKRIDLEKVTLLTILALIFSLGFSIGSDNELLASMPQVGINALLISLLAIVFSVAFLEIARKAARIK